MQKEQLINEMAEAIYNIAPYEDMPLYKNEPEGVKDIYRRQAKTALAAIQKDYIIVEKSKVAKYEYFNDPCYYNLWAVKEIKNGKFEDVFHVQSEDEAQALCELLNKTDIAG